MRRRYTPYRRYRRRYSSGSTNPVSTLTRNLKRTRDMVQQINDQGVALNAIADYMNVPENIAAMQNSVRRNAIKRSLGLRGRGAYWGQVLGQGLGGAAGRLASEYTGIQGLSSLGSKVGGYLGDKGSDGLLRLMGRGAYEGDPTVGNSLMNGGSQTREVAGSLSETGDIVIAHKEYLFDVIPTTTGFQTQYFQAINPGLSTLFPWFSQIASFFEEYEMLQLVFYFKSMVTEGNATAAGTIIMATQYNPTNAAFTAKQYMENYDFANSGKVTDNIMHGVECDPAKRGGSPTEYIRTGGVPTGQDPKTFDLGVFQIATVGCPANLNLGEIWVEYRVRLSKSKVLLPGQNPVQPVVTAGLNMANAATVNNPFNIPVGPVYPISTIAVAGVVPYDSTGGITYSLQVSNALLRVETISFPTWINYGKYLVKYAIAEGAAAAGAALPTVGNLVGCTASTVVASIDEVAPSVLMFTFVITLASSSGTSASFAISQGGTAMAAATTSASLLITQMNASSTIN